MNADDRFVRFIHSFELLLDELQCMNDKRVIVAKKISGSFYRIEGDDVVLYRTDDRFEIRGKYIDKKIVSFTDDAEYMKYKIRYRTLL